MKPCARSADNGKLYGDSEHTCHILQNSHYLVTPITAVCLISASTLVNDAVNDAAHAFPFCVDIECVIEMKHLVSKGHLNFLFDHVSVHSCVHVTHASIIKTYIFMN